MSDAELHGLVDGCLPSDRRADALRRAAASNLDRARIGAWQDQNELIRATFADVAVEPLPASLDLRTPPRLLRLAEPAPRPADAVDTGGGHRGMLAIVATIVLVCGGLVGSWMIASEPSTLRMAPVEQAPPHGSIEDDLGDRIAAALAGPETVNAPGRTAPLRITPLPTTPLPTTPLPTATIPDLTPAGFTFTSADATRERTAAIVFDYRNVDSDRIAIGAVRAGAGSPGGDPMEPTRMGAAYVWRAGDVVYAIAGTPSDSRLRSIARSLSAGARHR